MKSIVGKGGSLFKCPMCLADAEPSGKKCLERIRKRVEAGDPVSINQLACYYKDGIMGLPQDHSKANELFLQSGELGCASSYGCLADSYYNGYGVARSTKKAKHYWELASIGGNTKSRHNLGNVEESLGNMDRAIQHWMIAARAGLDHSLEVLGEYHLKGRISKDVFDEVVHSYKEATEEMNSKERKAGVEYMATRVLLGHSHADGRQVWHTD